MRIGIVDTTFSRVNMGAIALDEVKGHYPDIEVERRTVPGIKDLPVECKNTLDAGCDVCIALGMVGGAPIDTQCGHEASLGIQQAKLMTGKHIIEVFVHENEAWSGKEFVSICQNRIRKHVHNAVRIVSDPDHLMQYAGRGLRQGKDDEGPIEENAHSVLGIVVSEFNSGITETMRNTAVNVAGRHGIAIRISSVPGVFDMPLVVKKMLSDKQVCAVVTLGAVIKGETAHDEVITKDTAKRLGELALEFNKPVTLGIIGHAVERAMAEERAEEYAERAVNAALRLMKTMEE